MAAPPSPRTAVTASLRAVSVQPSGRSGSTRKSSTQRSLRRCERGKRFTMPTLVTLLLMAGPVAYALWIGVDFARAMVEFDETLPPCEHFPERTNTPVDAKSCEASESCEQETKHAARS